jgi:polyisoprenoid-binding protein YceI
MKFRVTLLTMAAGLLAGTATAATYASDPTQSRLAFVGVQAGAEFSAVFHRVTTIVDFAPETFAAGHIDVQIDLGSVDSQDGDRDGALRGSDLFDIGHWPAAHYVTRSIVKSATGYSALGTLTLRGVSKDVPIEFQFVTTPTGAKLTGTASLRRLDFGVGQGEYKSTDSVGDAVRVNFSLTLLPKK